jgi:hypothetical protein
MTTPAFTSPDCYRPHVDETFVVHHDGGTTDFTLTAVKLHIDDEIQCCFSLFFSGDGVLPQHLYQLSHPVLGAFDLFLVPIQKKRSGFNYEAVFNLLKDKGQ